jgi:catechol 2,3-dioxygenase
MRPQLKHLGIYVNDIERMERFYTTVFGLVVSDRGVVPRLGNREIIFLSAAADAHHQVVLVSGKDPASGPSVVFQMSFHVEKLDELRAIRSRLHREGIKEVTAIDHGNAWSIYASDPEGNGLEAYLDTPWHVAQPHGRPFDLSLPDETVFAATEAAVRKDPSFRNRDAWIEEMTKRLSRGDS